MSARFEIEVMSVRARLLQIVSKLESASGAHVSFQDIHLFFYFTNVLAPLWQVSPIADSVLKDSWGPYFPALQAEVDRLIGMGFFKVESFNFRRASSRARTEGYVTLDHTAAEPVLACLRELPDESSIESFLDELSFAYCDIEDTRRDEATLSDATYSDPSISNNRLIDFSEHGLRGADASVRVAHQFQKYAPSAVQLTQAEKLIMYMRLLKGRASYVS
jgi:hypothetical protein